MPNEIRCNYEERIAINKEIDSYMNRGIVNKVSHCNDEYISQIFTRPKKSGGTRVIINLSTLNLCVKYEHFKMETLNSVILLMERNCFMGSIDLKDA